MRNDKRLSGVAIAQQLRLFLSHDWHWGLILVLAVIIMYSPVWWAGYIWDDDMVVTGNPVVIGPLGLKEIWTTAAADICPLSLTTFWIEHKLWGLNPLPYHLVNVLLHGVSAVLLWRVLRHLKIAGAWLGAALWALHPVLVESVAWVTELKNTQSGLFFLLTGLFFVKGLEAGKLKKRRRWNWNYPLTLLFAALAMASKSSTVILPIVLCLCAWWIEGRWQWRNLTKLSPIFLMSLAAGMVTLWTQKLQMAIGPGPEVRTWPERLATAGDAIWFYLGKLVWPHPLMTVYPRWQIDPSQWTSYLALMGAVSVLVILWLKRASWSRIYFFTFAFFLVALFPVLGLINNSFCRYSFVADHFQYLAAMGPLSLAGAGLFGLAKFVIPERAWLQSIIAGGVLLALGILSWQRVWAYESQETLWTDTLAKNPNCWVGHGNLGAAWSKSGRIPEAIAQFTEALRLNPNYAEAHNDLGSVLVDVGKYDEAAVHEKEALRLNPNLAEAHYIFGNALYQTGRYAEAKDQYEQALRLKPDYADAHSNLGAALSGLGRLDEAIVEIKTALRLDPNTAHAQENLAKLEAMAAQGTTSK